MPAAAPADIAVNPNNTDQRYILWGNGRIDAIGGAVPILNQATWYDWTDQPVAVALMITNWATGAGYMLDLYGAFQPINGAPAMGTNGIVPGVPYTRPVRTYVDWHWDPALNGRGIVLDQYGQIYAFGGANAAPRSGAKWTMPFARKIEVQWSAGQPQYSVMLDLYGGLHGDYSVTAGMFGSLGNSWPNVDAARDFDITSFSPTISGYKLDLYGGVHSFGTNPATHGWPYRVGADVGRCIYTLSNSNPIQFWEVWAQGQQYEFVSSTPPTVVAGGSGTNEIQTVTISGSPTGGTFTLTYAGQTTTTQARNVAASALQTALEALSNIGVGDVSVTGGPGPGTPYTVTFQNALGGTDVAQMTAAHTFTGGTTPSIAVATTVQGAVTGPTATVTTTTRPMLTWSYSDSQKDDQAAWELYLFTQAFVTANPTVATDPSAFASSAVWSASGVDPNQRGVRPTVDLSNAAYRFYIRAKDTADQWSSWSTRGWTQSVALPATPTGLTATVINTTDAFRVNLSVTATTGGTANLVQFQWSTDGVNWLPVRGAEARPLTATTTATDYDVPLGQATIYRALAYAIDPRVTSLASGTATATHPNMKHVITSTSSTTLGGEFLVIDTPSWDRPTETGEFQPVGDPYAVVVEDGIPKSRRLPITIGTDTETEWLKLENVITETKRAGGLLVFRDPFGEVIYCRITGSIRRTQRRRRPYPIETTPLRHNHTTTFTLVEVRPPYLVTSVQVELPSPS